MGGGPGVLFSPSLDVAVFIAPALIAVGLTPVLSWLLGPEEADTPLFFHLLVVVLFDVGHVWGTFVRTHLDSSFLKSNRPTCIVLPIAMFLVLTVIIFVDEAFAWVVLGYLAIAQCIRQQWGVVQCYRRQGRENTDWALDLWMVVVCGVAPVLVWHADVDRRFDWFAVEVPLLFEVPGSIEALVIILWVFSVLVYTIRQAVRFGYPHFPKLKVAFIYASSLSWGLGILVHHRTASVLLLSLPHAIPSFAMVYASCRVVSNRDIDSPGLVRWIAGHWALFIGTLAVMAVLEESLWEVFVWKEYTNELFMVDLGQFGHCAVLSLLLLPQACHYVYELVLWDKTWGESSGAWAKSAREAFSAGYL
eukprot:Hpha_TRINITY_DN31304_c0_g1::TRINITY_DN31304_c0_g1_i1::g.194481::m.194481